MEWVLWLVLASAAGSTVLAFVMVLLTGRLIRRLDRLDQIVAEHLALDERYSHVDDFHMNAGAAGKATTPSGRREVR